MLTNTNRSAAPSFESQARTAVQRVRLALAEVLGELGADPRRPQLVADQLGVGMTLVWRAARIVVEDDAFTAIQHLPGASARKTLLGSFERAGARPESVRAVHEAMESFDRVVEFHAGDRETFAKMLMGLPGERQAERDEAQRKLAFQGNSSIWGIEAKVRLSAQVFTPSTTDDMLDLTVVSGMVGFRWLRANVPWPMFAKRYIREDGVELSPQRSEPLDPGAEAEAPPLWREFCSPVLPQIQRTLGADGATRFEIFGGAAGNTGQCTYINAWTDRAMLSRWSTPSVPVGEHSVWCSTPVETLLFDLYVHKSVAFVQKPSMHIVSQLPSGPGGDHRICELPVADRIVEIPSGPFDLTTPELPAFPRMMSKVFARLNRDPAEFSAFRFRLQYPPIAARATYRYLLPEKP